MEIRHARLMQSGKTQTSKLTSHVCTSMYTQMTVNDLLGDFVIAEASWNVFAKTKLTWKALKDAILWDHCPIISRLLTKMVLHST